MKTILIATDFSKAAENAAVYAVELADLFNAQVILFSAYQPIPVAVPAVPIMIGQEEVHLQVDGQLADTARRLGEHRGVSINTCSKAGPVTHSILEAVQEYQPDLVIAGMKKNGRQFRRLFGSTVTQLIRKIPVPLLVIPEDTKFSNIDTIALANESDLPADVDPHVLDALRDMAECFHSKLYLARVVNNRFNEAYEVKHRPVHLSWMIRSLDPKFKCIEGEDIARALTRFIKQFHVDVLAMLPHKYSLLERWFISSTTREMAFTTPIPLLVLPEKQISDRMSMIKIKQLQHESDTWKRALDFMRDENIYLKNRLAEVLKSKPPKPFLAKVESFQNNFLSHDDLIWLLRNDVAEFDKLLEKDALQDGVDLTTIEVNLKNLQNNIGMAEKQFDKLKLEFNAYLLDNI